jgi:uncharacterized protein
MSGIEQPLTFDCEGSALLGVLHRPGTARGLGILIIVGGPQYRVGSHRQFVTTARRLAADGYPVLRFDYRGMGDSAGESRDFESVANDVRCALDVLYRELPQLRGVVLYGLCDAASAAMMYAATDKRVRALVLANPWVRSTAGEAQSYLRHYYGRRLLQKSFWSKVVRGEFRLLASVADLGRKFVLARRASAMPEAGQTFIERMLRGWTRFAGPTLVLMSERDLTAQEFRDLCATSPEWRAAIDRPHVTTHLLETADHTFSAAVSQRAADAHCLHWLMRSELAGAVAESASCH